MLFVRININKNLNINSSYSPAPIDNIKLLNQLVPVPCNRYIFCNNNKIMIFGNGGSAAIASHFSVDLTKNAKVRCVNFNESDLITCFSNDYGYENWVKEALRFYLDNQDLVIIISSSGKSKNMINAAKFLKKKKNKFVTFTGFDGKNSLSKYGNLNFVVNSKKYN